MNDVSCERGFECGVWKRDVGVALGHSMRW